MTALNTYQSVDGFIGLAVETTQGTPVAATTYLDLLSESLEYDPAPIIEKLLRGQRDVAYNAVAGEQKMTGKITTPLYPDHGLEILTAAIGSDVFQTGGATTGSVTITANAAKGATGFTMTGPTTPAVAVGDYVEIRQNTGPASVTNLSEIHKVLTNTSNVIVFATGETLANAYSSATATVYRIASTVPTFTHQVQPDQPNANAYKTLTLEKCLGGLSSQQFAGCVIDKLSIKTDTKGTAQAEYDLGGALALASIAPSTPTYVASTPLALANYTATVFGSADTSLSAFSVEVAQGTKQYWTYNGQNLPGVVAPAERVVTGKWANILQNETYFNNAKSVTEGALTFAMSQTLNAITQSVTISLPQIVIKKASQPLKIGELVMFDADFQAIYNMTSGYSVAATIVTTKWLPLA